MIDEKLLLSAHEPRRRHLLCFGSGGLGGHPRGGIGDAVLRGPVQRLASSHLGRHGLADSERESDL